MTILERFALTCCMERSLGLSKNELGLVTKVCRNPIANCRRWYFRCFMNSYFLFVDVYSQLMCSKVNCCNNVVGTLGVLDTMVLQDNLCKFVEVLQTLSTGCFFGKAHAEALEMFGWRRPEAGEHS